MTVTRVLHTPRAVRARARRARRFFCRSIDGGSHRRAAPDPHASTIMEYAGETLHSVHFMQVMTPKT
ncbi:hypothetical protein WJ39_23365 [Burkholderia diffusa]|nr:hypothetical protein WJ39_23365 [Burkholderia diffusa]